MAKLEGGAILFNGLDKVEFLYAMTRNQTLLTNRWRDFILLQKCHKDDIILA